jgi:hypothetical protein
VWASMKRKKTRSVGYDFLEYFIKREYLLSQV